MTVLCFAGADVLCHCTVLKEMVDWFNAIRAARFHYLQVAFPGASQSDVSICTSINTCTYSTYWAIATTENNFFVYFLRF